MLPRGRVTSPTDVKKMRSTCLMVIVLALALLCASSCLADSGRYSMRLSSHPQAITADSHSAATISAEVRDPSGGTVPDGTVVEFTTSLGIIERSARTASGVARVRLESGSVTGTAIVSAVAPTGSAIADLRVDFLDPGAELFDESFISIASKVHLGYDADRGVVDSAGGVSIAHRGLSINAQEAQIDVKANTLRARGKAGGGDIVLSRGDKRLLASALYYDLSAMKGVLIGPAEEGAKRFLFRGRDLFSEPDTEPDESVKFDFEPVSDAKLFIRAKSILIRPGEEIKFKRANYYVDGDKVLSVPLQVLSLSGSQAGVGQMFAYGTDGVRLDVPAYYSLTSNFTGAVRLKHSEPTGWGDYSDRAGWQVDLDQEYNAGGSVQGAFSVNRVTSRDWGLRWNHRLEADNDAQVYTYLDFPSHRDLYGTLDYSRPFKGYTWSVNLRGNKFKDADGRYTAATYLQSRARPLIGNSVSYAFSTRLSFASYMADRGDKLGTGLGLQLYGKPLQFGPRTGVNTSLSIVRDWGGGSPGTSVYGNAGLYRGLGRLGQLGVNYSYSWSGAAYGYNSQRISTNLNIRPTRKWSASVYSVYGLNDHSISAFGDTSYELRPTWRLGFRSTYQKFHYANLSDFEIALAKVLGRQEARLTWSQSLKRFRFEFATASF